MKQQSNTVRDRGKILSLSIFGNDLNESTMTKLPKSRFHLVFSLLMGAMMVFLMTFVVTAVNIGFPANFISRWAKAFSVAYVVAVPVIYFLAPFARKLTSRFVETP
jgi:hypothetical protein